MTLFSEVEILALLEFRFLCEHLAALFRSAVPSTATNEKSRLLYPPQRFRQSISVALSRRLPVADVISYPAL